ncbi:hypothetical protein D3C85_1620800 [compost metagenome]
MNEALVAIYMQAGQHLDLLLIFHSSGDRRDARVVRRTANRGQEGSIRPRLHNLTGITVIHLDIGWCQLFQIAERLEVAAIVIDPPLETILAQHTD